MTTTEKQTRCPEIVNGEQCGLWRHGQEQEHIFREPQEPSLKEKILILELAQDSHHLWAQLWTVASPYHMAWLCDNGFLTEELQLNSMGEPYYPVGMYSGFSYSTMAPFNRITDKGREFLAQHIKAEW